MKLAASRNSRYANVNFKAFARVGTFSHATPGTMRTVPILRPFCLVQGGSKVLPGVFLIRASCGKSKGPMRSVRGAALRLSA
jgi:hypothetical protein